MIQKVYAHFKKAPANKKLGVLYVVDSVSRQWLEQARKSGQPMGSGAADGTFAAGVNHVTELLPSFMSDIIASAPEEQKVSSSTKKSASQWIEYQLALHEYFPCLASGACLSLGLFEFANSLLLYIIWLYMPAHVFSL